MTYILYYFTSFITDKFTVVFNAVHMGAFLTKAGYPLLGKKKGLFNDSEILHDKIVKNAKHLLYRFITPQDRGEFHETVDATHGVLSVTCLNWKEKVVMKELLKYATSDSSPMLFRS